MNDVYGRSANEWTELREAAEHFLVAVAISQGMTDYGSLNRAIAQETGHRPFNFRQESDRAAIGRLLGDLSRATNSTQGIMLSALVTHHGSNDEGAGFYKLAAQLGKMPAKPSEDEKLEAFVRLVREVHDHYAS